MTDGFQPFLVSQARYMPSAATPSPVPAESRTHLAVVETPFQLLNTIEAVAQLGLASCHLLALVGVFPKKSFVPLAARATWASVTYFPLDLRRTPSGLPALDEIAGTLSQLKTRTAFDRRLKRYGEVGTLLLGNYLDEYKIYMRHVHNVVDHRRVVLVDDGTDALVVASQLRNANTAPPPATPRRGAVGRLRARLRRRHVDWWSRIAPAVTFFTAFPLEGRATDRVVKNEYGVLRKGLAGATRAKHAVFLGQCLPEAGQLTLDAYSACVGRALARTGAPETRYVPHPRESPETVERIRADHGVEVWRPPIPIECDIVTSGRLPREVGSFFSSAIETCALIFRGAVPVTAYRIPTALFLQDHDSIDLIYQHFESRHAEGFQVISL